MEHGDAVIGEVEKNSREVLRLSRSSYKGYETLRLWVWYLDGDEWKPGKAGVAFRAEKLREVMDLLAKADVVEAR